MGVCPSIPQNIRRNLNFSDEFEIVPVAAWLTQLDDVGREEALRPAP
jgi:hypothetical protein